MKWNLVIILSLLLLPKQLSKSYFKVFVREKDNIELFEDYLRDYMDRVEKWKDNFYEKLYELLRKRLKIMNTMTFLLFYLLYKRRVLSIRLHTTIKLMIMG